MRRIIFRPIKEGADLQKLKLVGMLITVDSSATTIYDFVEKVRLLLTP